jgi:hypothetical protein
MIFIFYIVSTIFYNISTPFHATTSSIIKNIYLRSWPSGGRGLFPFSAPGFKSHCARLPPPRCLTCSLGLQDVQWAVGLVVVRASWPGHSRKKKKRRKKNIYSPSQFSFYSTFYNILCFPTQHHLSLEIM